MSAFIIVAGLAIVLPLIVTFSVGAVATFRFTRDADDIEHPHNPMRREFVARTQRQAFEPIKIPDRQPPESPELRR